MANCTDGCTCVIQAGTGISITGAGTVQSPIIISGTSPLVGAFTVEDSDTIDFSLGGDGTVDSPMVLSAVATISTGDLTDVNDPGGPAVGDGLFWDAGGYFVYGPPPANPPGAVNVGPGIVGDGSAPSPIEVSVIGTTAGGTTSGLEVYVDSAGDLRAVPPAATTVTWGDITGKPVTFTPSAHTHTASEITDPLNFAGSHSVGNAVRANGILFFVQSTAPASGMVAGDIWLW